MRKLSCLLFLVGVLSINPGPANAQSLTGKYAGSVENLTAGLSANFEIVMREHNGFLSGCMAVQKPLSGSGPLRGEVRGATVTFTATSPMFIIDGRGERYGNILSGTYVVRVADGSKQKGNFILRRVSGEGLQSGFSPENCPTTATLEKIKVGDTHYWIYTEYGSSYVLDSNFRYVGIRTFNDDNGEPTLMVVDQDKISSYYDGKGKYLNWISVQTDDELLYVYDADPYFYIYDKDLNYTNWYGVIGKGAKITFAKQEGAITYYYDTNLNSLNLYSFKLRNGQMVFSQVSGGMTYYYDSQMKPLGLYSFERNGRTLYGKVVGRRIQYYDNSFSLLRGYETYLPSTWYERSAITDRFGNTITGTSMRFGSTTLHSYWDRYGEYLSGSSIDVGSTTFHNLYSSYGSLLSGSSMRVGSNTFTNLYSSYGDYVSGTSIQVGNTTFHNLIGPAGVTTGTSIRVGNFIFHNFYGSGGQGTGTSIRIGNTTFSNYWWDH